MATIVVMPQLGNSVESCLIMEWAVKPGDTVAVDQTLCSIETDKATMHVPSTDAGTVLKLLWEEGDEVPVKDPLLILGDEGEELDPDVLAPLGTAASPEAAPTSPSEATGTDDIPVPTFATAASDGAVSPRARALAEESGLPHDALAQGSGPHGRVIARDVEAHLAANPATSAARNQGATGTGSGIGGRVNVADLATTPDTPRSTRPAPAGAPSSVTEAGSTTVTPLKGIRKVVAERMRASLVEAAQLSYTVSAGASGGGTRREAVGPGGVPELLRGPGDLGLRGHRELLRRALLGPPLRGDHGRHLCRRGGGAGPHGAGVVDPGGPGHPCRGGSTRSWTRP